MTDVTGPGIGGSEASTPSPLHAYVLARTDLPSLGRGKALAHAHHAGCHLTWTLAVEPLLAGRIVDADILAWHREGGGFGTTSAIGAPGQMDLPTIEAVARAAIALGQKAGIVEDPTYPYLVDREVMPLIDRSIHTADPIAVRDGWICCRKEKTVGWILGDKATLAVVLRRFDLVPSD